MDKSHSVNATNTRLASSSSTVPVPDFELTQFDGSTDGIDDTSIDTLIQTYLIPDDSNRLNQGDIVMDSLVKSSVLDSCDNAMNKSHGKFSKTIQVDATSSPRGRKQLNRPSDPKVSDGSNDIPNCGVLDSKPIFPQSKINNVLLCVTCIPSALLHSPATLIALPHQLSQNQTGNSYANNPTQNPSFGGNSEETLYVNAKQYWRILKRRVAREKLIASGRIPLVNTRAQYLHKSRHLHATKRLRGHSGRFLTLDTKKEIDSTVPNTKEELNEMETQRL